MRPHDRLSSTAWKSVATVTLNRPERLKKQVYEAPGLPRDEALQRAVDLMRHSFDWPDFAEAMRGRSEKRPPASPPMNVSGNRCSPNGVRRARVTGLAAQTAP